MKVSALCLFATGLLCGVVRADTRYFDTNGAEPGFGSADGAWAGAVWSADSTGSSETAAAATSAADTLFFGIPSLTLGSGTVAVGTEQSLGTASVALPQGGTLSFSGAGGLAFGAGGALRFAAEGSTVSFDTPVRTAGDWSISVGTGDFTYLADTAAKSFKTTEDVVVARNCELANYTPVSAIVNQMGRKGIQMSGTVSIWHLRRDTANKTLEAQFQAYYEYTKCVKIRFSQQGADIVARAVYARYWGQNSVDVRGYDFDVTGGKVTTHTVAVVSTTDNTTCSTAGYNIDTIGFEYRATAQSHVEINRTATVGGALALGVDLTVTCAADDAILAGDALTNAVSVTGALAFGGSTRTISVNAPVAGAGGVSFAADSAPEPIERDGFLGTTYVKIADNVPFQSVTNVVATLTGGSMGGAVTVKGIHRKETQSSVEFQFQRANDGFIKCVYLSFKNDGNALYVSAPRARAARLEYYPLGYDLDLATSYKYDINVVTSESDNGYAIRDAAFDFGTALTVRAKVRNAFPAGTSHVYGDLVCEAAGSGWMADPGLGANGRIVVHGGRLVQKANYIVSGSVGPELVLDHGTFLAGQQNTSDEAYVYLNALTLTNGSLSVGQRVRVGYERDCHWRATGTGRSIISNDVKVVGATSSTVLRDYSFDVDRTGDPEGIDLVMAGAFTPFDSSYKGYHRLRICKTGAGTLRVMKNLNWTIQPLYVYGGTFQAGSDGVFTTANNVVLDGGMLGVAAGKSNAVGALTVASDAGINIGAGATLSFASVADWTDGATLTVSGVPRKKSLRFVAGLTAAQLRSLVRYDGATATIDADGYVTFHSGTAVFLR